MTATNAWENTTGKMLHDLSLQGTEEIDAYTLRSYIVRLAREAKPLERNPEMFFFGYDEPSSMPSDCRAEYFYKTSYVATMLLMKAVLVDPMLLDERMDYEDSDDYENAPTLREVLHHCMLGCTGRGFLGGGYDDIKGLAETMLFFTENGARDFLEQHGDICTEYTELYNKRIAELRSAVEDKGLKGIWGDDHTMVARRVLKNYNEKE